MILKKIRNFLSITILKNEVKNSKFLKLLNLKKIHFLTIFFERKGNKITRNDKRLGRQEDYYKIFRIQHFKMLKLLIRNKKERKILLPTTTHTFIPPVFK